MARTPPPETRRAPPEISRKPLPPIKRRPPLAPLLNAPDPLDESKYPGDLEGAAKEELSQLQAGFRERRKAEDKRRAAAVAADFYFTVCFETSEQASAVLQAIGLRTDSLFVDGRELADRLGVELPAADIPYNPGGKLSPKLAPLVRRE